MHRQGSPEKFLASKIPVDKPLIKKGAEETLGNLAISPWD